MIIKTLQLIGAVAKLNGAIHDGGNVEIAINVGTNQTEEMIIQEGQELLLDITLRIRGCKDKDSTEEPVFEVESIYRGTFIAENGQQHNKEAVDAAINELAPQVYMAARHQASSLLNEMNISLPIPLGFKFGPAEPVETNKARP